MYKLNIIPTRKIWFSLSGILVGLSLIFFFIWGLNPGIDFTGGSLLEVQITNGQQPTIEEVKALLADLDLQSLVVQPTDNNGMILRFQETSEETHQAIMGKLSGLIDVEETDNEINKEVNTITKPKLDIKTEGTGNIKIDKIEAVPANAVKINELRFEAIGPSIGQELRRKSIYALFLVIIAIIIYVAWAFRKVSKPVASWKYGLSAIITLFHDVIIVVGLFSVLGYFYSVEVNSAFVAAILMVLGYSVNDTIVVFDRVRENLPKSDLDFEGTVNYSVNQAITRSINTSATTLLVLLSIVILGGDTIRYFAVALFAGVFVGTYSSIFLASPLLVWFEKIKK